MKTVSSFVFSLPFLLGTSVIDSGVAAALPEAQVVGRGPHHRVWQRVATEILSDGSEVYKTNSYTEIGTGIHYWAQNAWQETKAEFELFRGGAVAQRGPFQLILSPDIASEGSVDLLTPDGKRFISNPRWLAYYNLVTKQSTIVAMVKPCAGQLVSPNTVIFPDAFDDVQAAIRYTYRPGGIEQEIILLEQLDPKQWAMDGQPEEVVLEMWSEMLQSPQPDRELPQTGGPIADVLLEFGAAQIGAGKAFALGDEEGGSPVGKSWTVADQKRFLIEAVRQADLEPMMQKLPKAAQAVNPAQKARNVVQRGGPGGDTRLLAQAQERLRTRQRRSMAASITRGGRSITQGAVVDYSLVTTTSNFTFEAGKTYYVTNWTVMSSCSLVQLKGLMIAASLWIEF